MTIAGCPDLHIRVSSPINRREKGFFLVGMGKLKQILDHNPTYAIFPGDVFDNDSKTPLWVTNRMIEFLRTYIKTKIIAVYGQHDLENHTVRETTPLHNLELAGVVTIPSMDNPFVDTLNDIRFYGLSWDDSDDLLDVEIPDDGLTNVLVTHRMMIKDKPEWKDQKYYSKSRMFLTKNDFDLVFSGDNHKQFTSIVTDSDLFYGRKIMINSGALIRSGADYSDYTPCFHIFYLDTGNLQKFDLNVEPFEKVYNYEKYKKRVKTQDTSSFVSQLKGIKEFSIDFRKNLSGAMDADNDLSKKSKKEIEDAKTEILK